MKRVIAFLGVFILAGCIQSSEVLSTGDGAYMISVRASPSFGGERGAKREAMKTANTYCWQKEKDVLFVSYASTKPEPWPQGSTVEITFKCMDKNAPELKNPKEMLISKMSEMPKPVEDNSPDIFKDLEPAAGEE